MLYDGRSVLIYNEIALKFFKMAVNLGFEDAYSILAYKLAFGEAIKQDKIEEIKQFKSS